MWTVKFWKDAAERVIATFAQALIGTAGADAIFAPDVNWGMKFTAAGLAAGASLLKALAASTVGTPNDASLVK